MSEPKSKRTNYDPTPLIHAAIDNASMEDLIADGMTEAQARQEVAESRQMAECYDELMTQCYTDEQIGVLWEGKTPQEIIGAPLKRIPTVREVIDAEWMTIGDAYGKIWTREELDDYHRVGDLMDEKFALGYTIEQINAEWKGKSNQEILAAEAEAKKAKSRTTHRRTKPQIALSKTS